jgi:hypothetical protein
LKKGKEFLKPKFGLRPNGIPNVVVLDKAISTLDSLALKAYRLAEPRRAMGI